MVFSGCSHALGLSIDGLSIHGINTNIKLCKQELLRCGKSFAELTVEQTDGEAKRARKRASSPAEANALFRALPSDVQDIVCPFLDTKYIIRA